MRLDGSANPLAAALRSLQVPSRVKLSMKRPREMKLTSSQPRTAAPPPPHTQRTHHIRLRLMHRQSVQSRYSPPHTGLAYIQGCLLATPSSALAMDERNKKRDMSGYSSTAQEEEVKECWEEAGGEGDEEDVMEEDAKEVKRCASPCLAAKSTAWQKWEHLLHEWAEKKRGQPCLGGFAAPQVRMLQVVRKA